MKQLAVCLPVQYPARQIVLSSASRHLEAGLPYVSGHGYEGEHRLATFAMLALS